MIRARVGVLISGRGSNMEALVRAAQEETCPFEIALVLANTAGAAGLDTARAAGVEAHCIDQSLYPGDRVGHEHAIDAALRASACEWVALAGYMRVLTPFLVNAWGGRMINIHPSLLPLFPGLHTHERALAAGVKLHGASVHLVVEGVDEGPILGQAAIPVLADDTADSLAARLLVQEHRLYPAVLAKLVSGESLPTAATASLMNL
ncbi:MAG: purN [Caulobacteraceae bacterium]|nr:purN [Caulobacteraceae bacterium]